MSKIKAFSYEIECQVLFAMIKYGVNVFPMIDDKINSSSFSNPTVKTFFEKYQEEYRAGNPLSIGALTELLKSAHGTTEKDIITIQDVELKIKASKIAESDLPAILKRFIELNAVRSVMKSVMNDFVAQIENGTDVTSSIDTLASQITTARESMGIRKDDNCLGLKSDLDKREEYYKSLKNNVSGNISYGLKDFDEEFAWLSPGSFFLIRGETGGGKSLYMQCQAIKNHDMGRKVIIITIEMSCYDYFARIDSNISGIKNLIFKKGEISDSPDLIVKWKEKVNEITNPNDIMVYWVPEFCTPEKVDAIISKNPFKPDLVIVDYAGDMKACLKNTPEYSSTAQSHIYSRLKELAGKHKCVITSAQQVPRSFDPVKNKGKSGGSWAAASEHKSDTILTLYQTEDDKMEYVDGISQFSAFVNKNRHGPGGNEYILKIRLETMQLLYNKGGKINKEADAMNEQKQHLEQNKKKIQNVDEEISLGEDQTTPDVIIDDLKLENDALEALAEV